MLLFFMFIFLYEMHIFESVVSSETLVIVAQTKVHRVSEILSIGFCFVLKRNDLEK